MKTALSNATLMFLEKIRRLFLVKNWRQKFKFWNTKKSYWENATVAELLKSDPKSFPILLKNKNLLSYIEERKEIMRLYGYQAVVVLSFCVVLPLIIKNAITAQPYLNMATIYFWLGLLGWIGYLCHYVYKIGGMPLAPYKKISESKEVFNSCLKEVAEYLKNKKLENQALSYFISNQISLQRKMWILKELEKDEKATFYLWEKLADFLEEYEIIRIKLEINHKQTNWVKNEAMIRDKFFATEEEKNIFLEKQKLKENIEAVIITNSSETHNKKKTHKI